MGNFYFRFACLLAVFSGLITSASAASPGSLDSSFGIAGRVVTDIFGNDSLIDLAIQPNGKIVAVGANGTNDFVIVRYNANGSLDTTFSGDGIFTNNFGDSESYQDLAIQENGSILAVGFVSIGSASNMIVIRLTAAGVLDTTFDTDGIAIIPVDNSSADAVAIQSDGKILVGGDTPGGTVIADLVIARLNSNGSPDTSFGNNGIVITKMNGTGAPHFAIAGDKLIVGNRTNSAADFALERYNLSSTPTVTSDFDGDGFSDTAVFRPSTGDWFILRSIDSSVFIIRFGLNGDVPIDGDFDGDGKSDLAIFRPSSGVWFFQRSSNETVLGATFGIGTDKPVPGDYDKDGKTDIGVFRPATGEWLVLRSSSNFSSFFGFPFGQNGDIPISSERK